MDQGYLSLPGKSVSPDSLQFSKAKEVAHYLESQVNPFARLLECRSSPGKEIVMLEVDVELTQRPTHDIRHNERLAVVFFSGDQRQPDVLALRSDFPLVPHLNLQITEFPRSLCLYDQPYYEIKRDWTATTFVERVRFWLAQTAKGKLHADDQPLEPLMFDPTQDLILPYELLEKGSAEAPEFLNVTLVPKGTDLFTAIARLVDATNLPSGLNCVALVVSCPPHLHGVIRHTPSTLADLDVLLSESGLDLIDTLRQTLKGWIQGEQEKFLSLLEARMILVVRLPKKRELEGAVERIEARAFFTSGTIEQIGVDIGVWEINQGRRGFLLQFDEAKRGMEISLVPLNPRQAFSRSLAAYTNGFGEPLPTKAVAVGTGALGSQVVNNLVRAGFGQWTLVDEDVLLAHNLGRHVLEGFALGFPKATVLSEVLNATIDGEEVAQGIVANVLMPGENAELLHAVFLEAEVILDTSASVAVARYLCRDAEGDARRVSLFLNPSGSALTLLVEDPQRRFPLDVLEMQLYREIITNPELSGLLDSPGQLRTGNSCRDVSVQIPQDMVALHGGIGSNAFRKAVASDQATISIWRVNIPDYAVSAIHVEPKELIEEHIGEWTIYYDTGLRDQLADLRLGRLPKETGGVLIGAYDVERKIIYIVATVPSPPDSEEKPTSYIRGSKGLEQKVQEIYDATLGMLRYVGEWHSHPAGSGATPSSPDKLVLTWLSDLMDQEGLPGVMGIIGNDGELNFFLHGEAIPIN